MQSKSITSQQEGYWAFLTPEASKALDAYIRTRKLNGEHIDEESYLFATKQNARTRKNGFLGEQSVYKTLNTLYKKAGIIREKNGNQFDLAITYGFRKRFNGILKMENYVNSNIAEKLMVHKRGLDGVYLQPTREEGTIFHDGLCVVNNTDCQYDLFDNAYCSNDESLFMDGGFGVNVIILMIVIPISVIIIIIVIWIKTRTIKN